MRLPIPAPGDVVRLAEQGYAAAETAIGLVPRLVAVLGQVEQIVARVDTMIDQINTTQRRAAKVVERTDALTRNLEPMLERFTPTLDKLEPITARLVATTSPDEVEAVVQLVNRLPEIVQRLDDDILPILDTMATVSPDLRDLLDVSKELNEMLGSVPGMGRVKRKIEEQQEREDAEAEGPSQHADDQARAKEQARQQAD